ncbi:fimbrial biogenesis chaperone [Providencia stuartii]|uniref:fimbrial biogenesis chaperone n=1 Tax=Providencia stuartii TaxID=588 RepID=UPI0009B9C78B|nr:molecular chaperone [Providencia stuartii]
MLIHKQNIIIRRKGFVGLMLLLVAFVAPVQADNISNQMNGITLSTTRVIYPHDAKNGVTYSVTNNTSSAYLLQALILPWEGQAPNSPEDEGKSPSLTSDETQGIGSFIVLPPLQRFEPGETVTLRIRQKHNLLAQDKETIEVLSLTAIPAQADPKTLTNNNAAQLSMVLQNNLKLFYRPAGIPDYQIEKVEEQLQFSQTKTQLIVKNPTPFYVTFSSLSLGGKAVDISNARMIAPFSEQYWPLDNRATNNEVRWQLIDDKGGTYEANSRHLTQ